MECISSPLKPFMLKKLFSLRIPNVWLCWVSYLQNDAEGSKIKAKLNRKGSGCSLSEILFLGHELIRGWTTPTPTHTFLREVEADVLVSVKSCSVHHFEPTPVMRIKKVQEGPSKQIKSKTPVN